MGSVRHGAGVGGRVWGKLMSDDTTYAKSPQGLGDDDTDDGSGMGWVRRRREQREREKLDNEAKGDKEGAQAEKELEQKEPSTEDPESSPESSSSAPAALAYFSPILSPSKPSTPGSLQSLGTPITSPSLMSPSALSPQHSYGSHPGSAAVSPATDDEHLTRAIKIPAPRPRHHHGHHRRDSVHPADATEEADYVRLHGSEKQPPEETEDKTSKTACQSSTSSISSTSTSSNSTSGSGSETESGSDLDSESEDEDDSDEQSQEARKTSLGAGVEKISRHKS